MICTIRLTLVNPERYPLFRLPGRIARCPRAPPPAPHPGPPKPPSPPQASARALGVSGLSLDRTPLSSHHRLRGFSLFHRPARGVHGHHRQAHEFTRTSKSSEVQKLLDLISDRKLQVVDVKFCDLPGTWQHFSIPADSLDEDMISEGLGFDGSSIRGFQAINESDMLLLPDVSTAFVDPVLEVPTLSLTCDIYDPVTLEPYSRDPRFIAFKAEEYLRTTGIATTSYWGPEAEFFIFNSVRFDQNAHEGYYHIDSEEGVWNSGRNGTPTWATVPGTRRATSRCRRSTGCRTFAPRSCSR